MGQEAEDPLQNCRQPSPTDEVAPAPAATTAANVKPAAAAATWQMQSTQ
jgi:hypothetical protein